MFFNHPTEGSLNQDASKHKHTLSCNPRKCTSIYLRVSGFHLELHLKSLLGILALTAECSLSFPLAKTAGMTLKDLHWQEKQANS